MLGPNANAGDVVQMEQLWKMLDSMAESDPEQSAGAAARAKRAAGEAVAEGFLPWPFELTGAELLALASRMRNYTHYVEEPGRVCGTLARPLQSRISRSF